MIQFLLTLVGLLFPLNQENKVSNTQNTLTVQLVNPANPDTGGDTIPILPPKK